MIAIDRRLLAAATLSVLGHLAFARALAELPERPTSAPPARVEVRMVEPPAPPPVDEPPPQPEPEPREPPPRVVHESPRIRPTRPAAEAAEAVDTPPTDVTSIATDATAAPVFGVTMASTSSRGSAPVPVGNSTRPAPGRPTGGPVKPLAAPVAAAEVTAMPVPLGRCSGAYTDEARTAGTEGTVILDLVVDERGSAREIRVVQGLEHGLTRAAVTAIENCRFRPGEKNGEPVAVRVRGFKIRFLLQEGSR